MEQVVADCLRARALGTVVFLGLVVNQTAQLVSLATALHPTLGTAVLGVLLVVYAVCFWFR